jgi:hypothetical protein
MSLDDRKKIIDRIAKLLSLADASKNDALHETELALARAHKMMEEHNIKLGEVAQNSAGANGTTRPGYTISQADCYAWPELREYQHLLMHVIGKITTTRPIITKRWTERKYRGVVTPILKEFVTFVGDETDVAVACAMFPQLIKTIHSAVRIEIGPGYGRRQRCYCEGFVMALDEKVRYMEQSDSQCLAMVLAGKQLATQSWIDENLNLGTRKNKKKRSKDDQDAHILGFLRGSREDLGTKNRIT